MMSRNSLAEPFDLVVIGSGAAGLAAAVAGGYAGARVVVLEKSCAVGGTAAVSGGLLWVPLNPKAKDKVFLDSRDKALAYIGAMAGGFIDEAHAASFVDHAGTTLMFLEAATPLRLRNLPYPDTFPEAEGGMVSGRHVEPGPIPARRIGPWVSHVRKGVNPVPLTLGEIFGSGLPSAPRKALIRNVPKIAWRVPRRVLTGGRALVATLLRGALDLGVTFRLQTRAMELVQGAGGRVVGVVAEVGDSGERLMFHASSGVILASGGFEWDRDLVSTHLSVSSLLPVSPPLAMGDNLRLAVPVGARLARLGDHWHWPGFEGQVVQDGQPTASLMIAERAMPHSLWVNARGERFVNEAAHNAARALLTRDPVTGTTLNLPAWAIVDDQFRARYPLTGRLPGQRVRPSLLRAETLGELALVIGLDPRRLEATVSRFNNFARAGCDLDFRRGDSAFDRFFGDPRAPHPNLGTVERPPFYAVPVIASTVGTRGGPVTTAHAQVVGKDGRAIPGFYAAGNAAACGFGPNMVAGGATLMPALTFGVLAARHALGLDDHARD